ncbi:MAG: GAF domain-containing protein [Microscillaceae bacterium]|nr:GAF domain-containing protein [Microscillaceae bacterium]MDW8460608.1 GAF domain-containing protein [Cytophagales bacterium]
MKVNQVISTLLIIAFVVGVLFVTVLYIPNWGNTLSTKLELTNIKQVDTIDTALTSLIVAVGFVSILGLAAIFVLLLGVRNRIDVVYVHTTNKENQSANSTKGEDIYETENYTLLSAEFLSKLKNLIENNQQNRKVMYEKVLSEICKAVEAVQGIFYLYKTDESKQEEILEAVATFAYYSVDGKLPSYQLGEGLVGQVAKNLEVINVKSVPEGYITTISGLGKTTPSHLLLQPVALDNQLIGVLEIASFTEFEKQKELFVKEVASLLAKETQNTYK